VNWLEISAEWVEEGVCKAEVLRLIYQGRFLHGDVTLGALGLPQGKTTVMHLVPRENLPEPNSQGQSLSLRMSFSHVSKNPHRIMKDRNNAISWPFYLGGTIFGTRMVEPIEGSSIESDWFHSDELVKFVSIKRSS
jgi:hypothetical protein